MKLKHLLLSLGIPLLLFSCSSKELTIPYPSIPTNLTVSTISKSKVTLSWSKSTNTSSYKLYRDDIWIYQGDSLKFTDSNLKFNVKYKYNVSSLNSSWESPKSISVFVELKDSTLINPKDSLQIKPKEPKSFKPSEITSNSVRFTWDKVENALKYVLYRDNKKLAETALLEYKDENLKSGTIYQYYITSANNGGESISSSPITIKTKESIPSSPKNLVATEIFSSKVRLNWDKVENSLFYTLYRNGVKLQVITSTEFLDEKLTPNTIYEYSVTANNLEGESLKSLPVSVKTKIEDIQLSQHLRLGNPTNASTNLTDEENFLILKKQYALSYNNKKHIANWVSWELSKTWIGTAPRQDDFRADNTLPSNWYKSVYNDYTNSGFDRGHLCPSADRTSSIEDNSSTFLMTNIIPQAPKLNRESWAFFEDYCRMIVEKGYKAYIISGTLGIGGTGSNGTSNYVKNMVAVPKQLYKIALFLKEGTETFTNAKVVAIKVPNSDPETDNVNWLKFITSVSEIESISDCKFFSELPNDVQTQLKSQIFDISNNPFKIDPPIGMHQGNIVFENSKHEKYYFLNLNQRIIIK